MEQYADLNQIIQDYKISKTGGVEEFLDLQKRLSDVPILLNKFEEGLKGIDYDISDLITRAEFYDPPTRIVLLDEFVEREEADSLTGRIVLPYPTIWINGEGVSDNFYEDAKNDLARFLVLPDKRDPTARILSAPDCGAATIIYERDKQLYYIEIILTKDFL